MAVWDISKTFGITGLHTEKRDVRNKVEAAESTFEDVLCLVLSH